VILSENSLEHARWPLGCDCGRPAFAGLASVFTVSQDYDKLRHISEHLTPGLGVCRDAAGRHRQGHCRPTCPERA
jgi:feruloyl-CoA synthase